MTTIRLLTALGLLFMGFGGAGPAEAARVLVFNSTRYVDSNQGPAYPAGSQESDNVQASLAGLGHAVSTIAGSNDPVGACPVPGDPTRSQPGTLLASASEYASALAANDVFLIPEQESWCYLPGDLLGAPEIVAAWRDWVGAGGALIIHSSREAMQKVDDLFAVVFGFRPGVVNGTGVLFTRRADAAGTAFASGPSTLPGNESTGALRRALLPAGSASVYDDGAIVAVAIIPYRSGKIIFLGWDWTKSRPPFTDGQDNGWQQVLGHAVEEAVRRPEPPPPPPPIQTFADVPPTHWAFHHVEALVAAGVTGGCGGGNFCPDSPVTRAEMAVFLLRARGLTSPPPARGIFDDVPVTHWAAAWIEELANEGITAGCAPRRFCPADLVIRAEIAPFILRSRNAPGYTPPPPSGVFADVPVSHWAAAWIEQLVRDGIAAGCGGGLFCPDAPITRAQMAVFLVIAFGLGP